MQLDTKWTQQESRNAGSESRRSLVNGRSSFGEPQGILAGLWAIRKLRFARYLEEATFDNDFISIGSFSLSMPPRQCVSESSIVGTDRPASSRCDAQLP